MRASCANGENDVAMFIPCPVDEGIRNMDEHDCKKGGPNVKQSSTPSKSPNR